MYCSQCGKEISDDSKFCYSCGAKVEIKEKQDTDNDITNKNNQEIISDTRPSVVDQKNQISSKDSEQNTSYHKDDQELSPTDIPSPTKKNNILSRSYVSLSLTNWGWGWLILLSLYGYNVTNWNKNHELSRLTIIITIVCLPLLLFLYFKGRKILLKRKYFTDQVGLSSFVSGFLSLMTVMSIIGFSTGIDQSSQNKVLLRESEIFMRDFTQKTEMIKKKDAEYNNMFLKQPKTKSELNDKLLKLDEYKKYLDEKNRHLHSITNFYKNVNLKRKKDKSLDVKINDVDMMIDDSTKQIKLSIDNYKNHLITGDNKYYLLYSDEVTKQNKLREVFQNKLIEIEKAIR